MRVSLSVFCTNHSKCRKNCWGRIPGFHLSDKKKGYLGTLADGGGMWAGGGHSDFSMVSMCLPLWKPVRLDWNWGIIHECSRTYRNNAILSFDFIICQSEQFTMSIRLIFTHLIQSYPYLNSIYKLKYLDSMLRQISLFQICIISFSYKIELSTFKIEIPVSQLQIHVSVFKNKNSI